MRVTIAQLNPVVGDIDGNVGRLEETVRGAAASSDLVVFPELFVTGYPPRDLLDRPEFVRRAQRAVERIASFSGGHPGTGILFGAPLPSGREAGKGLYNAAVLVHGGGISGIQPKTLLPDYDVFDETRHFDPAPCVRPIAFGGELLGVSVCEDAWNDPALWPGLRRYDTDPFASLASGGATLMINISASPFHAGKHEARFALLRAHARRHGVPVLYVNQVGGNDELVFDGGGMLLDSSGELASLCPSLCEDVRTVDMRQGGVPGAYVPPGRVASVHDALVLGLGDYCKKTGFARVVIGLSGGIDSAVVCCLAAAALGPENVLGVSMPSPYSSEGSVKDSRGLAANLGVGFRVIPISDVFSSYLAMLEGHFYGREPDITEENIQARIRGNVLMALSNKLGSLVLSTGNKSELSVGYCTLYGDMCGGLSVISDVPKTMVYEIAAHINRDGVVIPRAIIDKAPSAELRPNQTDQDTLPPYGVLDGVLHCYIEEALPPAEIAALGFDPATVDWVVRAVNRSEYKRRQAAPGLRVTTKAFGAGRRMPIAARY